MDNDNIELLYKKFFTRFIKEQGYFSEYSKIMDDFCSPLELRLFLEDRTPLNSNYFCGYKWKNIIFNWKKINIDNKTDYLFFCKKDNKYKKLKYAKYILDKEINEILSSLKEEPILYILMITQISILIILTSALAYGIFTIE